MKHAVRVGVIAVVAGMATFSLGTSLLLAAPKRADLTTAPATEVHSATPSRSLAFTRTSLLIAGIGSAMILGGGGALVASRRRARQS